MNDNVHDTKVAKQLTPDNVLLKQTGAKWAGIYNELVAEIKIRKYSPKTLAKYPVWAHKTQTTLNNKDSSLTLNRM